jgi:hypothetical protein
MWNVQHSLPHFRRYSFLKLSNISFAYLHRFSHFISCSLYLDREAERKIITGLYVGKGSIFRSFSYTDRANKKSPFTLNLLRSLRNAVSYTWGSWPGVWNTFEPGSFFLWRSLSGFGTCQFVFRCRIAGEFDFNDPPISCRFFFAQS